MNTKRRAHCQLWHDWKERIIRIGDEQTSLQNQFDNIRNEFTDNSPRIEALEADVNALDGRLIIAESDIAEVEDRVTACENDIDRIDAELVDKTGEINNLANRMTLAEADIDDIDARLEGIEAGEILLSQLVPDADKDMAGKALSNVIIKPKQLWNPISNKALIDINPQSGNVFYSIVDYSHGIYYPTDGKTPSGDDACIPVVNGVELRGGVRFRQYGSNDNNGFVWEAANLETALMALAGRSGNLWIKGRLQATIAALNGVVITDGGTVDGVDVSTHAHDGTAIGGAKISYNNLADKPTIPTKLSQLATDENNQRVSAAEKAEWNRISTHTHDGTAIGGPKISYNDLVDKPDIPTSLSKPPMPYKKTVSINLAYPGGYIDVLDIIPEGRTALTIELLQYREIANIVEGTGPFVDIYLKYDDNTVGATVDQISKNGNTDWHPPTYPKLNPVHHFTKNYVKGIRLQRTLGEGANITGYVDIIGHVY